VYHGWKFDTSGNCVDMPNEPPESNFKDKIHHLAYPARERGGLVWVYMGPPETMPDLPDLEWARVPEKQRYVYKRWQKSNFAQAVEGGIDSSHVSFLHRDRDKSRATTIFPPEGGDQLRYLNKDTAPKFELVTTPYGFMIGARRSAEDDSYYWRITQFLLPWYTMIPPIGDVSIGGHAWVPIDDENCWAFSVNWHPRRELREEELAEMQSGGGIFPEKIPGTFRPVRNETNDYQIDRDLQRSGTSFTGIFGISEQDMACQESMGPVYDRTQEHLGAADAAIIQFRRRLLKMARDLEAGQEPNASDAAAYRVRSACVVLPRNTPSWPEAARSVTTSDIEEMASAPR
jgi:hypothetical protein